MRVKKIVCFFSVLLLFSVLLCSVNALPDTSVSFRGGGVTIDLTYTEEEHPAEGVWHNITITANAALTLHNFTVVIKAPVNSNWQAVFDDKLPPWYLTANNTLQWSIQTDQLPQETNGRLYCFIYIKTSLSVDYLSYTFYTTLVSEHTFSEMQEMLANYPALQANYTTLLNDYDDLLDDYTSLFANYTALLSAHNQLTADYNSKVAAYASLLAQYNKLSDDYDALNANYRSKITELGDLQTNYDDLNSTRYTLQASYNTLQTIYEELNQTYSDLQTELADLQGKFTDSEGAVNVGNIVMFIFLITVAVLIAFIVYLKRKKEDPYLVIRKETVSVKSDKET